MIFGKDTLRKYLLIRDGYTDAEGNYHAPVRRYGNAICCDAQPSNGKAEAVIYQDGQKVSYEYEVTLPRFSDDDAGFEVNDQIQLETHGHTTTYLVKGYQVYSNFSKLWV